jgi:hypothetical protein
MISKSTCLKYPEEKIPSIFARLTHKNLNAVLKRAASSFGFFFDPASHCAVCTWSSLL